ncbi:MAG: hypothetical protein E6R03_08020 [Hyphomicrobiaceae bacterium]|nr:MAG: hypothetical protein E6R03_08020 [Hyphomicrobiaceae bacterium]
MAAGAFIFYAANIDDLRINDITGATVKAALLSSSYTPSNGTSGHAVLADLTNEIANGNGYTTGGVTLSSLAATAITNGWKFSSGNASWTASGGNIPAWRYCVLYVSGTLWSKTSPLLGYFLGDSSPADVPATLDGNPLTINCPANGWFDIARA